MLDLDLIRSIDIPNSGTWYVAKDIADIVGYKDPSQAIRINCKNVEKLCSILCNLKCDTVSILNIKNLTERWHPQSLLIQYPDVQRLAAYSNRRKENSGLDNLYVIEFSTGVIKIGKSENLNFRINQHIINAKIHKVRTINEFKKYNSVISEVELIKFCKLNGKIIYGNEYFENLDFDSVVKFLNSPGVKANE